MKLSILMPVYNERRYLPEVFKRICAATYPERVTSIEIIAVDDGSSDGSLSWLQATEKNFSSRFTSVLPIQLQVHAQPKNQGKGAAIRRAIAHSNGDIVLIQDSDLEYHPREHSQLLEPLLQGKADAVFGSRFMGTNRRVLYFWHALANRCLTTFFNLLFNTTFTDIETGSKALRGNLARSFNLTANRFGIEIELSAALARTSSRIYEVGIGYEGRTYEEQKKIKAVDGIAAFFHVLRRRIFARSPYKSGMNQTLWALADASDVLYRKPLEKLIRELKISPESSVLEIGSGTGSVTAALLDFNRIVASDIDPNMVRALKDRFYFVENFTPVVWDASLPLSHPQTPKDITQGKFDLIVAFNVLEHLPNELQAVQQWSSLLSENGILIVLVPFSQWLFTPVDRAVGHYKRYSRADLTHVFSQNSIQLLKCTYLNPIGIAGWILNGKILKKDRLPSGQIKIYQWIKPFVLPCERLLEKFIGLSIIVAGKVKKS